MYNGQVRNHLYEIGPIPKFTKALTLRTLFCALIITLLSPIPSNANITKDGVVAGIEQANKLIDSFMSNAEAGDKLIVKAENLIDKFIEGDFDTLAKSLADFEALNSSNSNKLDVLNGSIGSQCKDFIVSVGNSNAGADIVDACYELLDSIAAAIDARMISREVLNEVKSLKLELNQLKAKAEAEAEAEAKAKAEAELEAKLRGEMRSQCIDFNGKLDLAIFSANSAGITYPSSSSVFAGIVSIAPSALDCDYINVTTFNSELQSKERLLASLEGSITNAIAIAKANAMKKTTITCVKGKLTKKVTAVKPKCPSGYKKK